MTQKTRVKKLEQEKNWRNMAWRDYAALYSLSEKDALDGAEYLIEHPTEWARLRGSALDEEQIKAARQFVQKRRAELEAEYRMTVPEHQEAEHGNPNTVHA